MLFLAQRQWVPNPSGFVHDTTFMDEEMRNVGEMDRMLPASEKSYFLVLCEVSVNFLKHISKLNFISIRTIYVYLTERLMVVKIKVDENHSVANGRN